MPESTPPVRDYLQQQPAPNLIEWQLTGTNLDTTGGNPLTGTGITAGGFVGNGFDAKLYAAVPAWVQPASADLSLHARLKRDSGAMASWREVGVSVGPHTSGVEPKIELNIHHPPNYPIGGTDPWVAIRGYNGSVQSWLLNRPGWRFEFRYPELIDSAMPLPQALCWLDSDNLLLTAYAGNKSVLYRWNAAFGEYTGRASSTTYQHINSLHKAQDGSVWCQCVVGGFDQRKRIDLDASFTTGAITESGSWNTGDVPTSALSFATVGGVEYALLSQFSTSIDTWIYVFLRSQMSGTVNQVDRIKRFRGGYVLQDLVQRASDGYVYLSKNGSGGIQAYDLAAILAGPDNAAPSPVATYPAATTAVEGLDFHPVTDRLWMCTEGTFAPLDGGRAHLAVWSTALTGAEENSYLIDLRAGQLQVRLNGRLMYDGISYAPVNGVGNVQIGARSVAGPGSANGYLKTGGLVRDVAIKSTLFTEAEFAALND